MTYEYDLRRLFRLPVDSLPLSEQLQRYRQRDLVPSHLYRLGAGLFGDGGGRALRRRRVADSKHFSPPATAKTPHAALLSRSLDGRDRSYGQSVVPSKILPIYARAASVDRALTANDAGGFSNDEYKQWLANRRSMRANLEGLGANEQWLCSKERSRLENTLLEQLRRDRLKPVVSPCSSEVSIEVESVSSRASTPTFEETRRELLRHRKQVLKEVALLERYLTKYRPRLVALLMSIDKSHDYCIFSSDLVAILRKMKAPISETCVSTFLDALPRVKTGRIDYRILLNGLLGELLQKHFKAVDEKEGETAAGEADHERVDESESEVLSLEKHTAQSTLDGASGEMADEYKQEELRQFQKLIAYCKEHGIVLDWSLAETALLLPPDRSKEGCAAGLRQPGLALLSSHFADPKEKEKLQRERRLSEDFGTDYKELRGRRKGKVVRLATGSTTVKPKIDCWLTYAEYKKLTEHIRSRPGFKYRRHELPDNNAFWPGALLDKLRLWLPKETLLDKPYSVYNVFQPVQHPKIYNPHSPLVTQRTSWPENSSGYVQFGGQNRKQYHV